MKIYRAMIADDDGENEIMATTLDLVEAVWATGDPLALHREVERLAGEGVSRQSLEDALESLLLAVRAKGASDDTEEIINGVWDRLTGWCHADQQIEARSIKSQGAGIDSPIGGKASDPMATSSTSH